MIQESDIETALQQTKTAIESRFVGQMDESGSACLERVLDGTIRASMEEGVLKWEEPEIRLHVLTHAERFGDRLSEMAEEDGGPIGEGQVAEAADEIIEIANTILSTPICPTWRDYQP